LSSIFIVDSNFFIQAHRATYPLDVATSYWDKVKQLADAGTIISIDKVKNEIYQNQDDLKEWCINNLPDDFFKDSSNAIEKYTQVIGWAVSRNDHYLPQALAEFLDAGEADAWLVAYALAKSITIVTHEVSQPGRKNKIKIPDACNPFGVSCTNTIDMLRLLGEQF